MHIDDLDEAQAAAHRRWEAAGAEDVDSDELYQAELAQQEVAKAKRAADAAAAEQAAKAARGQASSPPRRDNLASGG